MLESKKDLIIIGYSGHSYEIINTILSKEIKITGYCEIEEKIKNPFKIKFLGNEKNLEFNRYISHNNFFVCIGDNHKRNVLSDFVINNGGSFSNIIHPTAFISSNFKLGLGNYIGKNCSINSVCEIGNNVIINTSSIIEHECNIENNVSIGPGSVICGNVKIKSNAFIGANSTIIQGITIGENVIIGAGSVVLNDVPNNTIAFGNPAKIKK